MRAQLASTGIHTLFHVPLKDLKSHMSTLLRLFIAKYSKAGIVLLFLDDPVACC